MGPHGPLIVWDPTPGTAPVPLRVALTFPRVSTQTYQARLQVRDAAARAGATDRGLRTLEDCPLRLRDQGALGGRRWARSDRSRPRCQIEMSGPESQGGPHARGVHSRRAGQEGAHLQVRPWFDPSAPRRTSGDYHPYGKTDTCTHKHLHSTQTQVRVDGRGVCIL